MVSTSKTCICRLWEQANLTTKTCLENLTYLIPTANLLLCKEEYTQRLKGSGVEAAFSTSCYWAYALVKTHLHSKAGVERKIVFAVQGPKLSSFYPVFPMPVHLFAIHLHSQFILTSAILLNTALSQPMLLFFSSSFATCFLLFFLTL